VAVEGEEQVDQTVQMSGTSYEGSRRRYNAVPAGSEADFQTRFMEGWTTRIQWRIYDPKGRFAGYGQPR